MFNSLVTGSCREGKIVLKPFHFKDEKGGLIQVPAGFVTDGASIPRLCWSLLGITPFDDQIIRAAIIHDWLYATKGLSRRKCDKLFRRAMRIDNRLNPFEISVIYRSVRLFGWRSYRKTRELSKFLYPQLLKDYICCDDE